MSEYHLEIHTDRDFGIRIKGNKWNGKNELYTDDIKIKAHSFNALKEVVNNMEVIQINSDKIYRARALVGQLQTMVNNGNEYGHCNGNRWFVYEPIKYDLIV